MGLIAISVLSILCPVFAKERRNLSFTLTFTRDYCMHFNKAMLLWRSDIYTAEWCKGPHSNDMMQILPQKSHFLLLAASVSLFSRLFDVWTVEDENLFQPASLAYDGFNRCFLSSCKNVIWNEMMYQRDTAALLLNFSV